MCREPRNNMKKWTVFMLTPYAEWEGVEGATAKEAIAKCDAPEFDLNDGPIHFVAVEEEPDEH
jgi:hypothetical protein